MHRLAPTVLGLMILFLFVSGLKTAVFANVPHVPTATTYYVCECDNEADGDCVNGNDGNVGDAIIAPWRTFEQARIQFGNLAAGDAILFCQGGAFAASNTNDRWVNYNCTTATPCTVADYTPPWASGDENRPIAVGLVGE